MQLATVKNHLRDQILIPEMTCLHGALHQNPGGLYAGLSDEQLALFRRVFDPPEDLPRKGSGKPWRFMVLLQDVLERFQLGVSMIRERLAPQVEGGFLPDAIVELNEQIIPTIYNNLDRISTHHECRLSMLRFSKLVAALEVRYGSLRRELQEKLLQYLVRGLFGSHTRYSLFLDPRELGNDAFEEAFAYYLVALYVALFKTGNIDHLRTEKQNNIFSSLSVNIRRHLQVQNLALWPSNQPYAHSFQPSTGSSVTQSIADIQTLSDMPNWLRFPSASIGEFFIKNTFDFFAEPYQPPKLRRSTRPPVSTRRSGVREPRPGAYHHIFIFGDIDQEFRDEIHPGKDLVVQVDEDGDERQEIAHILPVEPLYHLDELVEIRAQISHHIARTNQLLITPLLDEELEALLTACEQQLAKGKLVDSRMLEAVTLLVLALMIGRDPGMAHTLALSEYDRDRLSTRNDIIQMALGELVLRIPLHEPQVKSTHTHDFAERPSEHLYRPTTLTMDLEIPKRAAALMKTILQIERLQRGETAPLVMLTPDGRNTTVRDHMDRLLKQALAPSAESRLERVRRHMPAWLLRHFRKDTWAVKQLTGRNQGLSSTQLHYTTLSTAYLFEGYRRYVQACWQERLPESSEGAWEKYVGSPHCPKESALFTWLHAAAYRLVVRLKTPPGDMDKVTLVETLNLLNIYCERLIALSTGLRDVVNPYIYACDIEPDGWVFVDDKRIKGGLNGREVYLPPRLVGLLRRFEGFCHDALDVLIKRKAVTKRSLWRLKDKKGYGRLPAGAGMPYLSRRGHFPGLFLLVYDARARRWHVQPYTRSLANRLMVHPEQYIPAHHLRKLARLKVMDLTVMQKATRFIQTTRSAPGSERIEAVVKDVLSLQQSVILKKLHLKGTLEQASLVTNANRHWLRSRLIEQGVSPVHVDRYLGHVRLGTEAAHPTGMSDGLIFREEMAEAIEQLLGDRYPHTRTFDDGTLINPFNRNPLVKQRKES